MEIFFPLSLFLFPIRGKSADPRVFLNRRDRAATLTAIRGHQGSDGFNRNRVCLLFVGKIFQIRLGYDLANLDRLDRERIWIVVEKKKKIDTISRNILKTKRPFSFCSHNGRRKYQKRSTSRALLAINQR